MNTFVFETHFLTASSFYLSLQNMGRGKQPHKIMEIIRRKVKKVREAVFIDDGLSQGPDAQGRYINSYCI